MKQVFKLLCNVFGFIGAIVTGSFIITAIRMWRNGQSFTDFLKDGFNFGYNWGEDDEEEEA